MSTISAHPVSPIEFNEDTIRAIFGHEAAEDETAQTDSTENVKTADTSHAGIYAALLTVSVASLIALGYVCIRKRRI